MIQTLHENLFGGYFFSVLSFFKDFFLKTVLFFLNLGGKIIIFTTSQLRDLSKLDGRFIFHNTTACA